MNYKIFKSFLVISTILSCASAEEQKGWWDKIKSFFGAAPITVKEDRGEGDSRVVLKESATDEQKDLDGSKIEPSAEDLPGGTTSLDGDWKGGTFTDSSIMPITPEVTDSVDTPPNSTNETVPNTMMSDIPQAEPSPAEPTVPTTDMPEILQAVPPVSPGLPIQEIPQTEPKTDLSDQTINASPQPGQIMAEIAPETIEPNTPEVSIPDPNNEIPGIQPSITMSQESSNLFTQQDTPASAIDENG